MIKQTGLWGLRILVPLGFMAALIWLGRFPMDWTSDQGMLRLGWRLVGTNIRLCRDYTEEERRTLPKHMQLKQHCTTSLLSYRLRVVVNGVPQMDKVVKPPGARGDRPLYVNEEMSLAPGVYRVEVRFEPHDPNIGAAEPSNAGEKAEREAIGVALAKATVYRMENDIRIESGRIVLVDLHEDTKVFEVVQPPSKRG